jgi:hypothetical protein
VSEHGFSADAKKLADSYHDVVLSPAEIEPDENLESAVVHRLRSLWAKTVAFSIKSVGVTVERPDGSTLHLVDPPADLDVLVDHLRIEGLTLDMVVRGSLFPDDPRQRFERLGLRDIPESCTKQFSFTQHTVGATVEGIEYPVFLRFNKDDGTSELHRVLLLEAAGDCDIEVIEVPLTSAMFGEVRAAYGRTDMQGTSATIVVSMDGDQEHLTVRLRRERGTEPVDHHRILGAPSP